MAEHFDSPKIEFSLEELRQICHKLDDAIRPKVVFDLSNKQGMAIEAIDIMKKTLDEVRTYFYNHGVI